MQPAIPDGVPMIGRGAHDDPAQGACLMELASMLAGEPFNDHPRSVDAVLAHLARLVNDTVDQQTRERLVRHVPRFIGTVSAPASLAPAVVLTCTSRALQAAPNDRTLETARRRARARLARTSGARRRWQRVLDDMYRCGPAAVAVRRSVAVLADTGHRDELADLLVACLDVHDRMLPVPMPAGAADHRAAVHR